MLDPEALAGSLVFLMICLVIFSVCSRSDSTEVDMTEICITCNGTEIIKVFVTICNFKIFTGYIWCPACIKT